jgi:hypothetical protein
MANPQYVEIQSALTSAEANLNRAHAAYQANQNFGTGLALGRARGEVNRLNRALASTPPYTASEILQAYQYQKFEAVRSAALKAVARVQSNRSRFGYSVKLEVPNSRELRREGVSGVLPGDKSGATNAEPGLPSMDELSSAVLGDFLKKAASEVRSAIAGYYAARASSEAEAAGDRIAAMLYLTDLGLNRYAVFA